MMKCMDIIMESIGCLVASAGILLCRVHLHRSQEEVRACRE